MDTVLSVDVLRSQMIDLFVRVFSDEREFVKNYITHYDTSKNRFVHIENGEVVSMLHCHRFEVGGIKGSYVYGVATDSQWRGQGLASMLLSRAFEAERADGIEVAVIIAESESLRQWYASKGFVLLDGLEVTVTGSDGMNFALDEPTMNVPMVKPLIKRPYMVDRCRAAFQRGILIK